MTRSITFDRNLWRMMIFFWIAMIVGVFTYVHSRRAPAPEPGGTPAFKTTTFPAATRPTSRPEVSTRTAAVDYQKVVAAESAWLQIP